MGQETQRAARVGCSQPACCLDLPGKGHWASPAQTDIGQNDRPEVSALETEAQGQLIRTCKHTHTHMGQPYPQDSLGEREKSTSSPAQAAMGTAPGRHIPHIMDRHTAPSTRYVYMYILHPSHTRALTPLCVTLTPSHHFPTCIRQGHMSTSHLCANTHDSLHPELPSGFLNGIHLSTLPAGHH